MSMKRTRGRILLVSLPVHVPQVHLVLHAHEHSRGWKENTWLGQDGRSTLPVFRVSWPRVGRLLVEKASSDQQTVTAQDDRFQKV